MIVCSHCGKEWEQAPSICMACGCRIVRDIYVTFKRRKANAGSYAKVSLRIIGNGIERIVTLGNGAESTLVLPNGEYLIALSMSFLENEYRVSINNNLVLEVYLDIHTFSSELCLRVLEECNAVDNVKGEGNDSGGAISDVVTSNSGESNN